MINATVYVMGDELGPVGTVALLFSWHRAFAAAAFARQDPSLFPARADGNVTFSWHRDPRRWSDEARTRWCDLRKE